MQQLATKYINGSVSIGGLKWEGGLPAELTDVVVKDAKGEKVAELPRTVLTLRPWLAMQKPERALSRIDVMRPKIYLTMNDKNMTRLFFIYSDFYLFDIIRKHPLIEKKIL